MVAYVSYKTHLNDDDQLLGGPLETHGRVLGSLAAGLHELRVGVRVVQLQGVDAPHVVPARVTKGAPRRHDETVLLAGGDKYHRTARHKKGYNTRKVPAG